MNDLWKHRGWLLHGMPDLGPPSSEPACFEHMGIELEACGFLRPNERQMLHWYTASIPVVRKNGSTDRTAGWVGTLIHDDDPILVVIPGGIDIIDDEADAHRIFDQANTADCWELDMIDKIAERICDMADNADGQLPPFDEIETLNAVGWDITIPGYPRYPRPATLSDCGIGEAYGLASEWLEPATD